MTVKTNSETIRLRNAHDVCKNRIDLMRNMEFYSFICFIGIYCKYLVHACMY